LSTERRQQEGERNRLPAPNSQNLLESASYSPLPSYQSPLEVQLRRRILVDAVAAPKKLLGHVTTEAAVNAGDKPDFLFRFDMSILPMVLF
jgi:hypothetical protein